MKQINNGKIICIGDVHGMLSRLKNLFKKLKVEKNDTVIFLGDYIDRGSDSKGVIDFIIKLRKKCNVVTLKGNHEMFAMDSYKWLQGDMSKMAMLRSWMLNGGIQCLESYDKESVKEGYDQRVLSEMFELHGDFFNNLQLTYETENHIFVHGHLAHEQDVEDQEEWQCLWGRYDDIWPHKSGKTVVCGHTIQRYGVKNDGFRIGIDTGSFLPDGYITAMVIDGVREYFVDSR